MKGIKIEVEHERPIFLYRPIDVIDAIAYAIYFAANKNTEMCVPNYAYEKADSIFRKWKDEVREKKTKKKTKFRASRVKFIWNETLEGKTGYVANNINELKEIVEGKCCADITTIHQSELDAFPFKDDIGSENRFFYLVK